MLPRVSGRVVEVVLVPCALKKRTFVDSSCMKNKNRNKHVQIAFVAMYLPNLCCRFSLRAVFRQNAMTNLSQYHPTSGLMQILHFNGPFPSCCLSRFRSESWCSTIVRKMSLICITIRNSFPFEWLCTRTRFETEACSNLEMGYWLRY